MRSFVRRRGWGPLALFIIGAGLRFFRLGRQSLWFDEILTVHDISVPLTQIHRTILASPPLYHYILYAWTRLGFHSDGALRAPSAFFGALALPVFYEISRRYFDRRAALWATALLAISPFRILFSQELRMYSLVFLLSALCLWRWHEAVEKSTPRAWALYAIVLILGLYVHNWFVFLWAAQALYTGWACRADRRRLSAACLANAVIVLAWLPWIPFLWKQARMPHLFDFLPWPGWIQLRNTFPSMAGLSVPCGDGSLIAPRPWLGIAIFCSLILFMAGLRKSWRHAFARRAAIAGFFGPLSLAFVISRYGPASFYHPGRYTILALPAFLWITAGAFRNTQAAAWARLRNALAAVWIAVCGAQLIRYFTVQEKAPWRRMAAAYRQNPSGAHAYLAHAGLVDKMSFLYYWQPKEFRR